MFAPDLTPIVRFFAVVLVACILFGIYSVYSFFFKKPVIKSDKIIVPEKRLVIKNQKVDTLYIYK